MDPLSEVLSLVNSQDSSFGALKTGGDWALRFPAPEGVKFNVVVRGACLLATDGMEEPIRLEAGDCFLVSCRSPLLVGSDLSFPPPTPRCSTEMPLTASRTMGKARIVS
ncbi:cupin domain-containing protein [Pseudomonas aeruginosa]|nr:cupin domain-containing protein [Pseudomonas aeruginosa]